MQVNAAIRGMDPTSFEPSLLGNRAPSIEAVDSPGATVIVRWSNGHQSRLPAIWLRDNCPCNECRHHGSGQRLLDTAGIPDDLTPASVSLSEQGDLDVTWRPDGHISSYPAAHLLESLQPPEPRWTTVWDAATMSRVPAANAEDVCTNQGELRNWLAAVDEFGIALLHGVPTDPGSVLEVVDLFGYVRETNYGPLFDVRSVVDPSNLAFSGPALGPHTDNPYRDPTPTLQLLHCLSSSTWGGDTTLVDGFRVAEDLRQSEPRMFGLLSQEPVGYRYCDDTTELTAEFPVIGCDERGRVTAIHFNNRSKLPFTLAENMMESYYEAYRTFAGMLVSPTYQISLRLEPGDLIIMDNLRVLHGRTGFSAAGERHLQGCYADRDGLRSKLAVLGRLTSPRCGLMQ